MTKLLKKGLMTGLFAVSMGAGVAVNTQTASAESEALIQCWTNNPDSCPQCCDFCEGSCAKGTVCCNESVE